MNIDRIQGVLVGMACGDALGAAFEGNATFDADQVCMRAGGGFDFGRAIGGFTDDTAMAVVIAQAAVANGGLTTTAAFDDITDGWVNWHWNAGDVGNQTRRVLGAAAAIARNDGRTAVMELDALRAGRGRGGDGNGALMRTGVVALAFLGDDDGAACVAATRRLADITGGGVDTVNTCIIWTMTVRNAVLTGTIDAEAGLVWLDVAAQVDWRARMAAAAATTQRAFVGQNGWTVNAFLQAWCAIANRGDDVNQTLVDVVCQGNDTDTVACIAGGLLGAANGATAFRNDWVDILNGFGCADVDAIRTLATNVAGL